YARQPQVCWLPFRFKPSAGYNMVAGQYSVDNVWPLQSFIESRPPLSWFFAN
ncbi:unnamed protein product, partial [Ceratitis capitata]